MAQPIPRMLEQCFWEVTEACNLRCIHCEVDAGSSALDELSPAEALNVIDEIAATGCRRVHLTGGEPLMRRDVMAIARRLSELGIGVSLITNGVLVTEAILDDLMRAGVSALAVSLDGGRTVHDRIRIPAGGSRESSYDAALHAIELAVASPLQAAVITQIHRDNVDDLTRMYEQLVDLGVDVWQVQLAMPLGRLLRYPRQYLIEPSSLESLQLELAGLIRDGRLRLSIGDNIGYYGRQEPLLRRSVTGAASFWQGCVAGRRVVALCANGDVKGCPSHPREFVVGNVRQTPLARIWDQPQRFPYSTMWDESLLEGVCQNCDFRRLCRAGCTTMAYATTGTIYDNPYCVRRYLGGAGGQRVTKPPKCGVGP